MAGTLHTATIIPSLGGNTKLALGQYLGATRVFNVKNFGAIGNDSNNDTAAIQAAIDLCFNQPTGNPYPDGDDNHILYFPPGKYRVETSVSETVTGAASGTGGIIRLTLSTTTSFATGDLVYVSGVLGTTEANGAWFIDKIDSTHIELRLSLFTNTWSAGGTQRVKPPCLEIKNVVGGRIIGAGSFSATIQSNTSNTATIAVDGWGYGQIEQMGFLGATGGWAFDLNWSNTGQSTQANTFSKCFFGGSGAYGLAIGQGGYMCSENLLLHCHFDSCTTAGVFVRNFNALQTTIIGGQCQSCAIGVYVYSGGAPIIHGMGFQNGSGQDIVAERTAGDAMDIAGCRSESNNFVSSFSGHGVKISACSQTATSAGVFCHAEHGSGVEIGSVIIDGCYTVNGTLTGNCELYCRGSIFRNSIAGTAFNHLGSFSGTVRDYSPIKPGTIGPCNVADLPAANARYRGLRSEVADGSVVAAGNFGTVVAGTSSNVVPVYCDGTNWRIG